MRFLSLLFLNKCYSQAFKQVFQHLYIETSQISFFWLLGIYKWKLIVDYSWCLPILSGLLLIKRLTGPGTRTQLCKSPTNRIYCLSAGESAQHIHCHCMDDAEFILLCTGGGAVPSVKTRYALNCWLSRGHVQEYCPCHRHPWRWTSWLIDRSEPAADETSL